VVAGRLVPLLGSVTVPIYVAGAVVTHGVGHWVLLGMAVLLSLTMISPIREPKRREAPGTVVLCVATVVAWVSLVPNEPILLASVLAVSMVYMGLMVPRPYAELGIGAVAVAYLASEFALGAGGGQAWQMAGVAATDSGMGALMLGIRIITERKVDERTSALAAANEKLERLSRTDPLTGLANRRRLEDVLEETWQHAEATGHPVSVIMVDIDYFKQYNDRFGHLGGDGCLQKLAAVLTAGARETDIVARYGGEEFAVVLADTGLATARQVAERLRQAVAGLAEEHPASPTGHLTVSVGVATALPDAETSRRDLLRRADEGLYLAKRNGRNQVAAGPTAEPAAVPQHE
jgi:diguanylate cyclase (GGDEF)-like protein